MYDFDYKHEFAKKDHTLEYEINYASYDRDGHSSFSFSPAASTQNYDDTLRKDHDNTIMNLDYSNPLSKKSTLELGMESRTLHNRSRYQTSSKNVQDADYHYDRYVYSAYANYKRSFDKLSMQLGVRLENFHVKAQLDGRTAHEDAYTTPYPSAFLTYKSSDENQYQLSYSRRVDRPGLSQVSPIRDWTTPTLISVGNPELRPQFTHSFEWNYTHQLKRGSLTASLFYRLINNPISRSFSADPEDKNRSILSYKNFSRRHAYGVEASYNNRFSPWWHMNAGFDLYAQKVSGVVDNRFVAVHSIPWRLRMNHDFQLGKDLHLQVFGLYIGAERYLQFESHPMFKMDTGLRYTFWHGHADLSLRVNDIFNSFHFAFDSDSPYTQHGQQHRESRTVPAGFTYSFSRGKAKARKHREKTAGGTQDDGML